LSFAGHVFDMLKRQAANRALQLQNRERFTNKSIKTHSKETALISGINFMQTKTPEELEIMRQNTLKEIKLYNRGVWIKTVVTFLIFIIIIGIFSLFKVD
jgi:hypothetical protein